MSTYFKDLAERVFWTAAEAGIGVAVVDSQDWHFAWAAPIAVGLATLKGLVARKVGDPESAGLRR